MKMLRVIGKSRLAAKKPTEGKARDDIKRLKNMLL